MSIVCQNAFSEAYQVSKARKINVFKVFLFTSNPAHASYKRAQINSIYADLSPFYF